MRYAFAHDLNLTVIQKRDSHSYHIYGNFATTLPMMLYIVSNINKNIDT